jgi:hypothetical protein
MVRVLRWFGLVMSSLFALGGVLAIAAALTREGKNQGPAITIGAMLLFVGLGGIIVLQLQVRSVRKAHERIRGTMTAIAGGAFDAPARVGEGYDGAWLIGPFGALSTAYDGANFTVAEGTARGARVTIASHPSVVGRQMFETCHVYSYVAVDAPGAVGPFRLDEQAGGTKLIASIAGARDVEVGDPVFDRTFLVDADQAVATRILDAGLRARLVSLRGQVPLVSQDFGAGRMALALNAGNLVIRWPGELSLDFAVALRDLLLDLRARFTA